ncbi:MAG TPA: TMEM175 family protein [Pseudonocardiaceae bacterium]
MSAKIKSPERLVFFSDAVVAIALTLLILPLTDLVRDPRGLGSLELIKTNQALIWSFLLSFVVIARYWLNHHRLYEQVKAYNTPLMLVNMFWLLTIAILPFPTEMVAKYPSHDRFTLVLYVGTLFVSGLAQSSMLLIIRNDADVLREPGAISDRRQFDSLSTTAVMGIALLAVAIFPALSYYPLLLNVLQPWVVRLRFRKRSATQVDG